MTRMLLLLTTVFLACSVGCGGCTKDDDGTNNGVANNVGAPHETEFFEPVPDQAAIDAQVASLLAEFEPLVDDATKASVEQYVNGFGSPTALDDPLTTVDGLLLVGETAFLMGSASGAIWAFLRALDLDPDNVYALSQLGFVLTYEQRYNEARPFLLLGHSLDEELHTILINLADNYDALGETERCVYYLERAVILQPDNGEIRHKMAKCYFKAGYDQAGHDALEVAQSLAPYDLDIEVTAAEPPGAQTDPIEGPGGLGGGNDRDAGKLIEAVGTCQLAYGMDYGERVGPYVGVGGAFDAHEAKLSDTVDLNAFNREQCTIACAELPADDAAQCDADCYAVECALSGAALASFRREILSSRSEWAGVHSSVVSGFAGCAWPSFFQLRARVPVFEKQTGETMIWSQLESAQENSIVTWVDVEGRVVAWVEAVTGVCSNASAESADIDWDSDAYFDPFRDLDVKICSPLLESFCLKMTNTSVSVSTPITIGSGLNLDFSIDARTGKFNMTVSVPLASKSAGGGVVEGGANLKFDMEKGVGVQGEGKVGGPLNKTWSTERYLFSGD